jgi:glycosyltransferase involved in cell wall biosynthesis
VKVEKCQICFVTVPSIEGRGTYILNSNLITVFESIIEGKNGNSKVHLIDAVCRINTSWMPLRIARAIIIQLKNAYHLLKLRKNNCIVFFTMGATFFLPMLIAKLLKKKTVYFISGLAGGDVNSKIMKIIYKQTLFGAGGLIFPAIISSLEELNYSLADIIVVESPGLAHQIASDKYHGKPVLNGALFVDIKAFRPKIKLSERADTVSYFGAITEHKGLMNLIDAIPLILKENDNIQFVIGGAGPALAEIKKRLKNSQVIENAKVVLCGKINHKEIPDYLNEAKLVVLPSYGEGLPNIVLEAMACGTLALATPVGGIPDVIRDGETGFIMEDNTPECIARNVIRALNHPDMEKITNNAHALIEREYTLEAAVERYRKILLRTFKELK